MRHSLKDPSDNNEDKLRRMTRDSQTVKQADNAAPIPAQKYRVVGTRKSKTAVSSRHVLRLADEGPVTLSPEAFATLHIHHIDAENSEVFWCRVKDEASLSGYSFYYQGIRQNATDGYAVKFGNLGSWQRPLTARPVFIFSIGRCGSTLFAKICDAAGLLTWSEPDALTNLAGNPKLHHQPADFRMLTRVALADIADKTRLAGQKSMGIKLRSNVTPFCEDLCSHHPESVCFFLVRDPVTWARSRHRLWGGRPVGLARRLSDMVETMRLAKARGLKVNVISYEALVADPLRQAERIAREVGELEVDPSRLDEVMGRDSQQGTTIGRDAGREIAEDFNARFVRALRNTAPWLLERKPEHWLE